MQKTCLITTGATASFDALITSSLSSSFLSALSSHNYTHLVIQYGKSSPTLFNSLLAAADVPKDLHIEGISFTRGNFRDEVGRLVAKGEGKEEGCLVAHAGTGSLLDGLHFGLPTVLVPNPALADNHQNELAEKFQEISLCMRGDLDDLAASIVDVELWRKRRQQLGDSAELSSKEQASQGIWTILDQEMGYIDRDFD